MGADADELPDGFTIRGRRRLDRRRGGRARRSSPGDGVRHRGAGRHRPDHASTAPRSAAVSYPGFLRPIARPTATREGRQDLSGRLHGRRQNQRRPGPGPRLGWRAEDIDERIERARAPRHSEHLRQARRALLPRRSNGSVLIELLPLRGIDCRHRRRHLRRSAQPRADAARRRWSSGSTSRSPRSSNACRPTAVVRWRPTAAPSKPFIISASPLIVSPRPGRRESRFGGPAGRSNRRRAGDLDVPPLVVNQLAFAGLQTAGSPGGRMPDVGKLRG